MAHRTLDNPPHANLTDDDLRALGAIVSYWALAEFSLEADVNMLISTPGVDTMQFAQTRWISITRKLYVFKKLLRLTCLSDPDALSIGLRLATVGKEYMLFFERYFGPIATTINAPTNRQISRIFVPRNINKSTDHYGDNEAEARFHKLLKAAINTPPNSLKSMTPIRGSMTPMRGVYRDRGEAHLHRYIAEFEFRHNRRTFDAPKGIEGKRLTYRRIGEAAHD